MPQHPDPATSGREAADWTEEEHLYHELHDPATGGVPDWLVRDYPSHLHIDLKEIAQGRGFGVKMMSTVLDALRADGSCGVHLCMHKGNSWARRFYEKLGFQELPYVGDGGSGGGCIYGLQF